MIEIRGLHKAFGENRVLRGVDLTIETGKTIVIVGRSGCGKSVLLKHIVRLLEPDAGTVLIDGSDVNSLTTQQLYELRKRFGFLFQGSALFDSMTCGENIALPLTESDKKYPPDEITGRVREKLEMVGLPHVTDMSPSELSGGMKKRVALARALVTNPEYILYDEPTTGLDPIMSDSIDSLISELSGRLNVTAIVVTHDMFSVKNVADTVAMMHEGEIYFTGAPDELLSSREPVIYDFIKRTESL